MLPAKAQQTMKVLCGSLENRLPGAVEAVYLYGSTALGAYVEGSSDIDFIAVVGRPLSEADIAAIAEAHDELEHTIPGTDIMGCYLRPEDLGKPFGEIPRFPAYFEKSVRTDGSGADINPITWWILKRHGICVYGRGVPMEFEVSANTLVTYVLENMNTYWKGWIDRLEDRLRTDLSGQTIPSAQLDYAVEWCALGMLRQLYSIRERDITSKIGAGEYGLKILPDRWHRLIREAIAIKRGQPMSEYGVHAQPARLKDLVELLTWIHAESNRLAGLRRQ